MDEITLKIRMTKEIPPRPLATRYWKDFSQKKCLRICYALGFFMIASAVAAGKLVISHPPPQPPLIPTAKPPIKEKISTKVSPVTPWRATPEEKVCLLELRKKHFAFAMEKIFPACRKIYFQAHSCTPPALEFAEALYLYAYALSHDYPHQARMLLLNAKTVLRHCPAGSSHLPGRVGHLLQKISHMRGS